MVWFLGIKRRAVSLQLQQDPISRNSQVSSIYKIISLDSNRIHLSIPFKEIIRFYEVLVACAPHFAKWVYGLTMVYGRWNQLGTTLYGFARTTTW